MKDIALTPQDRVLVLGATGFIGKRLVRQLVQKSIRLRLLVRDPSKAAFFPSSADVEVVKGDIVKMEGTRRAFDGIHSAFYLIHSMGGKGIVRRADFAEKDRRAAHNFVSAAEAAGLKRVIYLGGLGEEGDNLSEHLRSRAEIARILSSSEIVSATILRAAVIIGAGGASYEMLRYLVERLPVMICPRWIDTNIQPIAVRDVLAYLTGCLLNPGTAGKRFDICGPDTLTYRKMMEQYAEARGIARRFVIGVPFLTPQISAYWVDIVTPVPAGIAHPLIEGLKNEVVCRERGIDDFVSIVKTPYRDAVKIAFSEEKEGPGVTGF